MNNLFLALYVKLQTLMNREEGQDLVEYALLVALIALALIGSVQGVASAVSHVFTNISTTLA
jgi:pilus assembly protein Flp/PilA